MTCRIGIDVGGTFTDVALYDEATSALSTRKVPTTPDRPAAGIVDGVREILAAAGATGADVRSVVHGTTLVSNTLIERTGARVGLITTEGFRDILETRNGKRYDLYDLDARLPEPLVSRRLRVGVRERVDADGRIVVPLDEAHAERAVRRLLEERVEAVAVCLLHSFRHEAHERRIGDIARAVAPDVPVSLSVDVAPKIREHPRLSTTVINAYVQPRVQAYLTDLEQELARLGFPGTVYMMFSGAVTTSAVAKRLPVRITESGPAAGALAASLTAEQRGLDRLVSFDLGGTTAKICFIERGRPAITQSFEVARVHRFKHGSGHPIALPALDMIEIGAGGGSIAHRDGLGLVKVGPASAGSTPGPVCYRRGGTRPTVTDADLVLGYLTPDCFAGGRMELHVGDSHEAIRRDVADPLEVPVGAAARGIFDIVNENMANAARVFAAEHGRDLRRYALVAFGGAGPVHAAALARRLGVRRVIVPPGAGVLSAVGFLAAPFAFDFVHSYLARVADVDWAHATRLLEGMAKRGAELLAEAGVPPSEMTVSRSADMRYVGQIHEISVPLPAGALGAAHADEIRTAYEREYERLYRRANLGYEVELLDWHVVVRGPRPPSPLRTQPPGPSAAGAALKGRRAIRFGEQVHEDCPRYERHRLSLGALVDGPAILEDPESTIVVPPGASASIDEQANVILDLEETEPVLSEVP